MGSQSLPANLLQSDVLSSQVCQEPDTAKSSHRVTVSEHSLALAWGPPWAARGSLLHRGPLWLARTHLIHHGLHHCVLHHRLPGNPCSGTRSTTDTAGCRDISPTYSNSSFHQLQLCSNFSPLLKSVTTIAGWGWSQLTLSPRDTVEALHSFSEKPVESPLPKPCQANTIKTHHLN